MATELCGGVSCFQKVLPTKNVFSDSAAHLFCWFINLIHPMPPPHDLEIWCQSLHRPWARYHRHGGIAIGASYHVEWPALISQQLLMVFWNPDNLIITMLRLVVNPMLIPLFTGIFQHPRRCGHRRISAINSRWKVWKSNKSHYSWYRYTLGWVFRIPKVYLNEVSGTLLTIEDIQNDNSVQGTIIFRGLVLGGQRVLSRGLSWSIHNKPLAIWDILGYIHTYSPENIIDSSRYFTASAMNFLLQTAAKTSSKFFSLASWLHLNTSSFSHFWTVQGPIPPWSLT